MKENSSTDDEQTSFQLRLVLRHPKWTSKFITDQLGLSPTSTHSIGQPRVAPNGERIGGIYDETIWRMSNRHEGNGHFFDIILLLLEKLEKNCVFLTSLEQTGGSSSIIVDLDGSRGAGDVITWAAMKRISDLRINLSIEVFRDFR